MSFGNLNARSPSLNRVVYDRSPINRTNWLVDTFFDAFSHARTEDKEAALRQLYIVHLDRSSNYSNYLSKAKTIQAQMDIFSREGTRYKFINRQKSGKARINNRLRIDLFQVIREDNSKL